MLSPFSHPLFPFHLVSLDPQGRGEQWEMEGVGEGQGSEVIQNEGLFTFHLQI